MRSLFRMISFFSFDPMAGDMSSEIGGPIIEDDVLIDHS
jgi:hypothetical protein